MDKVHRARRPLLGLLDARPSESIIRAWGTCARRETPVMRERDREGVGPRKRNYSRAPPALWTFRRFSPRCVIVSHMPPGIPFPFTMPRKRKDLAPPPKDSEGNPLVVDPRIKLIFEKYGDPLEGMAQMADELKGDRFSDDAISTRARLLAELAKYGYAQFKGRDADGAQAQAQKVEINITGIPLPKVVPNG